MRVTFVRPGVKFLPGMAYISLTYNNNLPESHSGTRLALLMARGATHHNSAIQELGDIA
jgi:hypothetical protein